MKRSSVLDVASFFQFSIGMKHIPSLLSKGDASPAWSCPRVHHRDTDPVSRVAVHTEEYVWVTKNQCLQDYLTLSYIKITKATMTHWKETCNSKHLTQNQESFSSV